MAFRKQRLQPRPAQGNAERKISAAMPVAGAGAELAGEHLRRETEKELRETAGEKPTQ
jgi:hypothetical protein